MWSIGWQASASLHDQPVHLRSMFPGLPPLWAGLAMKGILPMKPKMLFKILLDILMTILLLLLMARQLTGNSAHEWLGAGLFALWVPHHILNFGWYRHLRRGRFTPLRIAQTVVNFLLLLAMLGTMLSGILLSREVFAFLPISGGLALARPMHILCTFWCFVLLSLHLGLHWNMMLGIIRRAARPASARLRIAPRAFGGVIAAYGLYAFLKNQVFSYLFLISSFVFFDFERPALLFFVEYIAIMGLFVFLAHYGAAALQRLSGRRGGRAAS